ncbi:FAD-dependent oxidoreductase [Mangrovactinospora gilvigrisea]|uniref:FAD-dependent oxidoreductase n=1 Tax=Mangrovactinospora gilvigrisea TaxID=1428644 RepID=A0A1J7BVW8_9ACTN|nr:FAD-dependent monooxygenase [Mangrovactinospora gilvigrisea]OIV37609.1 FAD-dependent oxidoreductase [Mangrovactinospora gilvigrisea]
MASHNSHPEHPSDTAVLVAGAGPTGLLLAGDLARAGVPVTVLERRHEGVLNLSRAFTVHARTLEQLDARPSPATAPFEGASRPCPRGVADDLIAAGHRLDHLGLFLRATVDFAPLHTRFPFVLAVPQYETERQLLAYATAAGARVVWGAEVVGVSQDDKGVEVEARDTRSAAVTVHRGEYLVGADGHRSAVRGLLGLPFPGRTVIRSMILADVRLTEPPQESLRARGADQAFALVIAFGDGWHRVIAWDRANDLPVEAPVAEEDVREILGRTHRTDYGMHAPRWLSRFEADERQVPRYRVGRVLLAGDAAHVHTPAGGQGMNTGLQDAANLGWKLAAAVRGRAPDDLLESYQTERHPVGRAVVRSSGAMIRLAMAHNPPLRARRAAAAAALAFLPPVRGAVRRRLSGIGFAYPAPRGAHRLVGRRSPDLALREPDGGPVRLYQALREGRFVLVTPPDIRPRLGRRADLVRIAHWSGTRRALLVVRPDAYIAWASDTPESDPMEALRGWT